MLQIVQDGSSVGSFCFQNWHNQKTIPFILAKHFMGEEAGASQSVYVVVCCNHETSFRQHQLSFRESRGSHKQNNVKVADSHALKDSENFLKRPMVIIGNLSLAMPPN